MEEQLIFGDDGADMSLKEVKVHIEEKSLKCILTRSEIRAAGERMARAEGEKRENEATLKSVVASYKAKIDEAAAIIGGEAEKIRAGYEFREVEVQVIHNYETGKVNKYRIDTGEEIESRAMTAGERQMTIL
jgi:hypothetical protein